MTDIDEFKILVGGYYGILEMDEYDLKVYVLKELEDYIRNFILLHPISSFDYEKESLEIGDHLPLKRKLQDSLLALKRINRSLELELLIKKRIREIQE